MLTTQATVLAEGSTSFILRADGGFVPHADAQLAIPSPLLEIGSSQIASGRTLLQPEELPLTSCSLILAIDFDQAHRLADAAGASADNLILSVFVDDLLLARRTTIRTGPLNELKSINKLELDPLPEAMMTPQGFDLRIVLFISGQMGTPLKDMSQEGTWLVSEKFELRRTPAAFRFSPIPLTDELRKKLRLSNNVLSHVEIMENVLEAEVLSDVLELYIDDELLRVLAEDPDSPASFAFQIMFANQALTALLNETVMRSQEINVTATFSEDMKESAAGRFVEHMAAVAKFSPDQLMSKLQRNPALSSSVAQQFVEARKKTVAAVKAMR